MKMNWIWAMTMCREYEYVMLRKLFKIMTKPVINFIIKTLEKRYHQSCSEILNKFLIYLSFVRFNWNFKDLHWIYQ